MYLPVHMCNLMKISFKYISFDSLGVAVTGSCDMDVSNQTS